jgi:hypothetical protein
MGVTLYAYSNYDTTNNRKYIDDSNLGVFASMPSGWGDEVDSIKIEPGGAYEWCGWQHPNQTGVKHCYTNSTPSVQWHNAYSSRSVKKMCNHASNIWDQGCDAISPDINKYVENCNINSTCWNLRGEACKNSNLAANPLCKKWCKSNPTICSTAIKKYCESLPIDTMLYDDMCGSHIENIRESQCTTKSNLFSTTACKQYCKGNPDKCRASAQTFCQNNFNNPTCKEFCVDDNIKICTSAIKKYCKGNTIKSDPYCQNTLVHPLMVGQHDLEMQNYCNNLGKQINLENVKSDSATKSKTIEDKLENPICACFDKQLINTKFDYVRNSELKTQFTSRPQCFYYNCINDSKAYKKTSTEPCNLTICSIDIGQLDIQMSDNVKIDNNCGPSGLTNTPDSQTGAAGTSSTGTSNSVNSNNKIDCQMTKWSECSNKCTTGKQTRDHIAGPLNGGQPCGPTSQDCKIPCTNIKEQLQNSYFNFYELDQTNKILFIVIVCLIIIIIIIFMLPNNQNNQYNPYNPYMQYNPQMQYNPRMQMQNYRQA